MWLWNNWFNPNSFYSYCLFVPFISGVLMYQKIRARGFKPKGLIFPICFLAFMFPLPEAWTLPITHYLKSFTAFLASILLNFIHLPAWADRNVINLPHGTVIVDDACSGIRALLSLFAMGTVFCYWMRTEMYKKALLLLAIVPIALFVNASRISFLSIVTEFWGARYTIGLMHDLAGVLLYGLAFLLLLWTKRTLETSSPLLNLRFGITKPLIQSKEDNGYV